MNKLILLAVVATLVGVSLAHNPNVTPVTVRWALLQKVSTLNKVVDKIVEALLAQHKEAQAVVIVRELAELNELSQQLSEHITDLRDLHWQAVEKHIRELEEKLEKEMLDAHYVPPHTGSSQHMKQLFDRAASLERSTAATIAYLKMQHREAEIAPIEKDAYMVRHLVNQLHKARNPSQVLIVQKHLEDAEDRLTEKIKKVHQNNPDAVHREQLLKRATELQAQVDAAIKFLRANKRDAEAVVFETEESVLKNLVTKIAKPTTSVQLEEAMLDSLEVRLEGELEKLHAETEAKDPLRVKLLARATELVTKVEEAIKKLKASHRNEEAELLTKDEVALKALAGQLKTAKGKAIILLEKQLAEAETRLGLEIGGVH